MSILNKFTSYSNEEINQRIENSAHLWNSYVITKIQLFKSLKFSIYGRPESLYAEHIVKIYYNGEKPYNPNNKFYDIECENKKIEVKSICRQSGTNWSYRIKSQDRENFVATHYAFVFFKNFTPEALILIKADVIKEYHFDSISKNVLKEKCEEYLKLTIFHIDHLHPIV
jgi:hypothetical protein